GAVNDLGGNVTGTSPGFIDEGAQDFHLTAGSACVDAGTALAAAALPVDHEYGKHHQGAPRAIVGPVDRGAVGCSAGTPPAAPTGLAAVAVSSAQIDLSWTDNSADESGFAVERSADAGAHWATVASTGTDVATYADVGLASGTTYSYRVRATNGNGTSGPSNVTSATTGGNSALCQSGVRIERATLVLRASPFSMVLTGRAVVPKPWIAVDPAAGGVHVRLDGLTGAGGVDAALPGGAAWIVNAAHTRWTYRDPSGTVAGITRATLADLSRKQDGLL